jgi:hypothetical protein
MEVKAAEGEPARAVPMRRDMVRVPLARAAALVLVGASKLTDLIADTETSRAMLASAIDLLENAPQTEDGFLGPLPEPVDAARRIVGRLCGVLPPAAAYLRIDRCRVHLDHLGSVFAGANVHFARCASTLRFADDSPQWQRWRRLTDLGADQFGEAEEKLFKADARAVRTYWMLLDLVRYWSRLLSLDRMTNMVLAEDDTRAAMKLVDEALAAMRQMLDVVTRQANVMIMTLAPNQASSSSVVRHRRHRSTRTRGTRGGCRCM